MLRNANVGGFGGVARDGKECSWSASRASSHFMHSNANAHYTTCNGTVPVRLSTSYLKGCLFCHNTTQRSFRLRARGVARPDILYCKKDFERGNFVSGHLDYIHFSPVPSYTVCQTHHHHHRRYPRPVTAVGSPAHCSVPDAES